MVDAFPPGLQVGKRGVDPGQDDVGRHGADDMRVMVDLGQPGIARQTIGLRGAARGDRLLDEGIQLAVL